MNIVQERTRIIFTDYTDRERKIIEDLASTTESVFIYEDLDNNVIAFPSGMANIVKEKFKNYKIEDKSSTYWDYSRITPIEHKAEPRNQMQIDFIKFTLDCVDKNKKVGGVLPPGSGKTFMACYSAIKVGMKTLIIAPTNNVKEQWATTLTGMFKVPSERVTVANSPKDFINAKGDFVITTQASLGALNKTYDLEKIMKANKFGIKIIDEAHMFFGNTVKVDGSCNIKNNWYLTGTFGRSAEEENALYHKMFGDIEIFRVADKAPSLFNRKPGDVYGQKPHMNVTMVWAKSDLTDEEIKKITSSMRYSERSGKWMRYGISVPAYTELIIPSDGRMTKYLKTVLSVVKMANNEVTYGKTLILTSTIASVNVLKDKIQEMYPNKKIGTINSKNPKSMNDDVKANAEIMISTVKSCGTGFDVKDLSKLIVVEQFKSWILADQVSGRLRIRPDKRDTYMWDIVDSKIPQLRAWANNRANILKRKSKLFKVVKL